MPSKPKVEIEIPTDPVVALQMANERIAELESANQAKDERIDELEKKEEGWLVTTPNPMYDGNTLGVKFKDGMAFVPKQMVFPDYVTKPLKKSQLASYPADEQEKLIERSKRPSSERVVERLEHDFYYKVEYFGIEKVDDVEDKFVKRAKERALAEQKVKKDTMMNAISQPKFIRGG